MHDQFRFGAVGDVEYHHAGVAPGAVGGVAVNDRMMQAVTPRRLPGRYLAGRLIHAGNPPAPSLAWIGRVTEVNGDENVICESVQQHRGIGPAAANVPDAVDATASGTLAA